MAVEGGAEEETTTEYESDPEEAKISLKMRRREASDDEEEELEEEDEGGVVGERRHGDLPVIGADDSEGESDGQGAAADYNEEGEEEEKEDYCDEGYEDYDEVEEREDGEAEEVDGIAKAEDGEGHGKDDREEVDGEGEVKEGEKKEAEPSAVPTSGAFYMHDDRFRENDVGRSRRAFGGKKLWESKDERKWGHDKFEELNTQVHDRHYDEGRRSSKGYYRGRGRARGSSGGYPRGGRGRGDSGSSSLRASPKDVRGRGPRKYQPAMKNKSDFHPPHNKQPVRSLDKKLHTCSGREAPTVSSDVEHESAPAKKAGSNLSSASPPFYPSGASDVSLSHKKGVQPGNKNINTHPSSVDQQFPLPSSNSVVRGKDAIASGMDKLHIDDSVSYPGATSVKNMHMRSSASSLGPNQLAHPRGQGRVVAPTGSAVFQQPQAINQVNKVSPQGAQANLQFPAQTQGLSPLQPPGQQLVRHSVSDAQSSSPPKAGKETVQGNGRGSIVYGGSHVMGSSGNAGAGHGDPNAPGFIPVMQFGGQRPDGIPALGMAFPGYVAQPNGFGNSEMAWLPVLASAAGAMGAMGPTYCPPYLSVDGNYHPPRTNQTSALPASGKNSVLSKPIDQVKAHHRPEVANDDFSQRQNKPRRYSEMSFSQGSTY